MYRKVVKRVLDIAFALIALLIFWWLYLIIALLVLVKLGRPVIFRQPRPGKKDENGEEKIFEMYKFRSMTNHRDENGKLLPDDKRLRRFGRVLRETSLDELPEIFNILKGDMSLIGPRPQLVRDMVFMTPQQRRRHDVQPGLSGLAQINGRNSITWEEKLNWDLKYIGRITFINDAKIVLQTIFKVFEAENVNADGLATAEDYGDYLLRTGKITREEYDAKQAEAEALLRKAGYDA